MRFENEVTTDRQTICNLFAKFFTSVYAPRVEVSNEIIYDPFSYSADDLVSEVTFSVTDVQKAIQRFDVNKVASPDNIPMMFFMKLAMSLSLPLSILFNKSLMNRKFPTRWKISYVSPIFKEGDKNDVSNYRPVSILCAISKIFERLVFNMLFDQIKSEIHHSQHGFFAKRSTQTNLMEYVSNVAQSIIDGGQVDTIYTDFSKAFDKVDHALLVAKLKRFGFKDNLLNWFDSYLTERSQFVVIGGTKSHRIVPSSGVPQGSILGPLLFILFINDLLSSLSSGSGFADDLKIYRKINDIYDCNILQSDVHKIVNWCAANKMIINIKKCAVMSTSYSRNKCIFPYKIHDDELQRVSTKKDLGVIMDDKLSFSAHVEAITKKSYRMLGFIFRCGKYFNGQKSMMLLFNALVRNRLEYCSTVWNPYYANAVEQVERVQRKFTRMFYYKFNLGFPRPTYPDRLKRLRMYTLESRRLINDELMLYKLIHGHADSSLRQKLCFNQPQRTTRQASIFYLPKMTTNYERNSPIHRIQRNHDTYFSSLDLFDNRLPTFKGKIKNFFEF